MNVKFKLYDQDMLRKLGHSDESIRKVPFYLYVDKEFIGELSGNNIVYNDYNFNSAFAQYIRLEKE